MGKQAKKKEPIDLGTVVKIYPSGMRDTDKGFRVSGEWDKGVKLERVGHITRKKLAVDRSTKAKTLTAAQKKAAQKNREGQADGDKNADGQGGVPVEEGATLLEQAMSLNIEGAETMSEEELKEVITAVLSEEAQ